MLSVAAMLAGVAFTSGVAFANKPDANSNPAGGDQKIENDILVKSTKASVDGHAFTAYRLGSYHDVQFDGDTLSGYNMVAENNLDTVLKEAVKAAVIHNGVVDAGFTELVDTAGEFKGEAKALSPLQFVNKYFHGAGSDVYGNEKADKTQLREFADYLVKNAKDKLGAGVKATGENGKVDFDLTDDQNGLYLITETTAADKQGDQTVARAMVVGTALKHGAKYVNEAKGYKLGEIQLKADKVTVQKTVSAADQTAGVGSVRNFTITSNVPNYRADETGVKYEIGDTPSANLSKADKVKVAVDVNADGKYDAGDTELAANTDYTVEQHADNNGFTIKFKTDTAAELAKISGKKLVVNYDMTVANLSTDTVSNQADVTYSNNPYDKSSSKTTKTPVDKSVSNARLYHVDLNLEKVKYGDAATKLQGAKFEVTRDGQAVKFTVDNGSLVEDKAGAATDFTMGRAHLKGLAANSTTPVTYHFKETQAPAGYVLGDHPVEFDVKVTPESESGVLKKVKYEVSSQNHANFIDLGLKTAEVAVNPAADTTAVTPDQAVLVENTTSLTNFAKTGGEILLYVALAAGLGAAGSATLYAARKRRTAA
jgi:hypothetical protein